jgi:hypothetical protein
MEKAGMARRPAETARGRGMVVVGVAEVFVATGFAATSTTPSRLPARTRTFSVAVVDVALASSFAQTLTLLGPGAPPLEEETSEVGVAENLVRAGSATTPTSPAARGEPTAGEATCVAQLLVVQISTATHDATIMYATIRTEDGMEATGDAGARERTWMRWAGERGGVTVDMLLRPIILLVYSTTQGTVTTYSPTTCLAVHGTRRRITFVTMTCSAPWMMSSLDGTPMAMGRRILSHVISRVHQGPAMIAARAVLIITLPRHSISRRLRPPRLGAQRTMGRGAAGGR